jgi:secreted PhoX family phosphatase
VAPWGDLIVCEDGPGSQNLLRVMPDGTVVRFGTNTASDSEFAGSTFSPNGSTLFVNMQVDGLTLAITGPWEGFAA